MSKRILIGLSELGYWGEELVGPLETFDKAGYESTFFTRKGRRPIALGASKDSTSIDPPVPTLPATLAPSVTDRGPEVGEMDAEVPQRFLQIVGDVTRQVGQGPQRHVLVLSQFAQRPRHFGLDRTV